MKNTGTNKQLSTGLTIMCQTEGRLTNEGRTGWLQVGWEMETRNVVE